MSRWSTRLFRRTGPQSRQHSGRVSGGSSGEQAEQELTKLKTFATRFLELALARGQQMQVSVQPGRDTFGSTDAGVTPPVPIRQEIPLWPSPTLASTPFEGELEVIIDAAGDVRETRLTTPIHPAYDPLILDSARGWKYRPATKDSRSVTYRKVITISLMPQRRLGTDPNGCFSAASVLAPIGTLSPLGTDLGAFGLRPLAATSARHCMPSSRLQRCLSWAFDLDQSDPVADSAV